MAIKCETCGGMKPSEGKCPTCGKGDSSTTPGATGMNSMMKSVMVWLALIAGGIGYMKFSSRNDPRPSQAASRQIASHWVSITVVENKIEPDGSFKGVVVSSMRGGEPANAVVTGSSKRISGDLASLRIETVNGAKVGSSRDSDLIRLVEFHDGYRIVFPPGARSETVNCWVENPE